MKKENFRYCYFVINAHQEIAIKMMDDLILLLMQGGKIINSIASSHGGVHYIVKIKNEK